MPLTPTSYAADCNNLRCFGWKIKAVFAPNIVTTSKDTKSSIFITQKARKAQKLNKHLKTRKTRKIFQTTDNALFYIKPRITRIARIIQALIVCWLHIREIRVIRGQMLLVVLWHTFIANPPEHGNGLSVDLPFGRRALLQSESSVFKIIIKNFRIWELSHTPDESTRIGELMFARQTVSLILVNSPYT